MCTEMEIEFINIVIRLLNCTCGRVNLDRFPRPTLHFSNMPYAQIGLPAFATRKERKGNDLDRYNAVTGSLGFFFFFRFVFIIRVCHRDKLLLYNYSLVNFPGVLYLLFKDIKRDLFRTICKTNVFVIEILDCVFMYTTGYIEFVIVYLARVSRTVKARDVRLAAPRTNRQNCENFGNIFYLSLELPEEIV